MENPLDQILPPDFSERRIYAYQLKLSELTGRIKVGETTRAVASRVMEQVSTAGLADTVEIIFDQPAVTRDGRPFRDTDVHEVLKQMQDVVHISDGGGVEWFKCTIEHVKTAFNSVYTGDTYSRLRDKNFELRVEQRQAIDATDAYYTSAKDAGGVPRFLWNAKMRFGKTFAAYHLAKQRGAKRVLVVTYKPAVEDAWRTDLETHVDFESWIFYSRKTSIDPTKVPMNVPLVCFSSIQDLRGHAQDGSVKDHNKWIHDSVWDLIIVDEYHYGAWNTATQELLAGEEGGGKAEYAEYRGDEAQDDESKDIVERLSNVKGRAFLCLSGTPFRAIASKEFSKEQIFNWTYTDEQRAKSEYSNLYPNNWNPYQALPGMNLLVYELPEKLRRVAIEGTRNEFDLNLFFKAEGNGANASFIHKDQVQGWLYWLSGQDIEAAAQTWNQGTAKPFPYSDTKILPLMNHTVWFLPSVAAVYAMTNLLNAPQNVGFWQQFNVLPVAGKKAGVGLASLEPVRNAIRSGLDTKTITLTCGKLMTGVTVPQWSAILMLNNLESPESYFQAAFRVQSPWSSWNTDGTSPNQEKVVKPTCLVLDFAPNRALRLFADYGMRLGDGRDADKDVEELRKFLPVLGFDGTRMRCVEVSEIIDTAFQNTSIDTRRMKDKRFIFPKGEKLDLLREDVRQALLRVSKRINSDSSSASDQTVVNHTPEVENIDATHSTGESNEEHSILSEKELTERLTFLATRINAFMYVSDDIEKNLHDVLCTEETSLFREFMELEPSEMKALVDVGFFNEQAMRLAIHQFRRTDESSFGYTGLNPRSPDEDIGVTQND
jgi:hypothetical protein